MIHNLEKRSEASGEENELEESRFIVEMIEAVGAFAIDKLTDIANQIYTVGTLPQAFKESELIVIPEKEGAVDCSKHRKISIMSQKGKIVLKVLDESLKAKVNEHVDEEQYGFRNEKGTKNVIFILRTTTLTCKKKSLEELYNIHLAFFLLNTNVTWQQPLE